MRTPLLIVAVLLLAVVRAQAATFVVDSTLDAWSDDVADGICDDGSGNCTMREALFEALVSGAADTITCSVSGTTIPLTAYQALGDGDTIDCATDCGDLSAGTPPTLSFIIDGNGLDEPGVVLTGTGATVRGLHITGFGGGISGPPGIDLSGTNNTAECNRVSANSKGIRVGGSGHTIGGPDAGDGNVIDSNVEEAIPLVEPTGTLIEGNWVGTTTGNNDARNGGGINVEGADDTTIRGNVLAKGIAFAPGSDAIGAMNAVIIGNSICVGIDGTTSLGHTGTCVDVTDAPDGVTIGTLTPGEGNLIRGGVTGIVVHPDAVDVAIRGNTISHHSALGVSVLAGNVGTIIEGNTISDNGSDGVRDLGTSTVIGGATTARNVVRDNAGWGITVDAVASGGTIHNNHVGTNAAGDTAAPNVGGGIFVEGDNVIVGDAGLGNVVSGNTGTGIRVMASAAGSVLEENLVGLAADGTTDLCNGNGQIVDQGTGTTLTANVEGDCTPATRCCVVDGSTVDFGSGEFAMTCLDSTFGLGHMADVPTCQAALDGLSQPSDPQALANHLGACDPNPSPPGGDPTGGAASGVCQAPATATPTVTSTGTATATSTATSTETPSSTPTFTGTPTPVDTATATATGTVTVTATVTPTFDAPGRWSVRQQTPRWAAPQITPRWGGIAQ